MSLFRLVATGGLIGIAVASIFALISFLESREEEEAHMQANGKRNRDDPTSGRSTSLRNYNSQKTTNRSNTRDQQFWEAYASTTYERECVLCLHNKADTGFLHGDSVHVCMCEGCMMDYLRTGSGAEPKSCPLCRQPYEKILNVQPQAA